jgi:hypothetical protein
MPWNITATRNDFISRGGAVPWHALSPGPLRLWLIFMGCLKSNLFVSQPRTIKKLKQRTMEEIAAIPEQMDSSGDAKSSRKAGAVFKKWWGTSDKRNFPK